MTTLVSHYRPELEPLPPRLQRLPVDARGYPVPWFVQWLDEARQPARAGAPGAVPEFRLMDREKWILAVRDGRCWVCGDVLGAIKAFVIGPMCGINRTTSEPPCHRDCAEWSARNCPFLARPQMVRRDNDGLMEANIDNVAGTVLTRNPGVALLWFTKSYRVFDDGRGKPLIEVGPPLEVAWYAEGRLATRAEVDASVVSGLPALEAIAADQDAKEGTNGRAELARRRAQLELLYPRA